MSNYVCYNELDVMYMTGVFNKVFRSFVEGKALKCDGSRKNSEKVK